MTQAIRISVVINLLTLAGCALFEDKWEGPEKKDITFIYDGRVEARLNESEGNICMTLKNISGKKITNLIVAVQLYSSSTRKDATTLLVTRWLNLSIDENASSEKAIIHEVYSSWTRASTNVVIVKIDDVGVLGNLPGEYEGTYTLVDIAKAESTQYIMSGFIAYSGEFSLQAQHGHDLFLFLKGAVKSDHKFYGYFYKIDDTVLNATSGTLVSTDNVLSISDHPVNDLFRISFELKKVYP